MVQGRFTGGELPKPEDTNWKRQYKQPLAGLGRVKTTETAASVGLPWQAGKDGVTEAKAKAEAKKKLLKRVDTEVNNNVSGSGF